MPDVDEAWITTVPAEGAAMSGSWLINTRLRRRLPVACTFTSVGFSGSASHPRPPPRRAVPVASRAGGRTSQSHARPEAKYPTFQISSAKLSPDGSTEQATRHVARPVAYRGGG